ncbi:MAG: GNAT family N-acetyltransferase [Parasporobacterium sp.]|nr:GNAT family N-acetyltransferase [Parasporobacterium sp.]
MIRRAEAKDLEAVNELLKQVLAVHANGRPDIFIPDTKKYRDEELLEIFKNDDTPVFVFTDENDHAWGHAFCVLEEVKGLNNMHDMKTLYVDDICVDENHRHQGIASALYSHVREYAKSIDCYRVTLNVWEINPGAKAFYVGQGLKTLKTTMEDVL